MTWIWILLLILSVLSFLLISRVTLYAEYDEKLKLKVGYFFLKFHILPQKEKEEQKQEKKGKKSSKKQQDEDSSLFKNIKSKGVSGFISTIKETAQEVLKLPPYFVKHIKITKLDVSMTVATDDAAKTAINYGRICAAVYPAISIITSNVKSNQPNIAIKPNFDKNKTEVLAKAKVKMRLMHLIIFSIKAFISGYKLFSGKIAKDDDTSKNFVNNNKKDGAKNDKSSN